MNVSVDDTRTGLVIWCRPVLRLQYITVVKQRARSNLHRKLAVFIQGNGTHRRKAFLMRLAYDHHVARNKWAKAWDHHKSVGL